MASHMARFDFGFGCPHTGENNTTWFLSETGSSSRMSFTSCSLPSQSKPVFTFERTSVSCPGNTR
jgi:hypothetical protein